MFYVNEEKAPFLLSRISWRHSRPESSSHRDTVLRVVDDNPRQSQIVVMKTERGYLSVDVPLPAALAASLPVVDDSIPSISHGRGFIPRPCHQMLFAGSLSGVAASGEDFGCSMGNVIAVEIQNLIRAKTAIDLEGDEPHRLALTSDNSR